MLGPQVKTAWRWKKKQKRNDSRQKCFAELLRVAFALRKPGIEDREEKWSTHAATCVGSC
jgi:hypothetical protein